MEKVLVLGNNGMLGHVLYQKFVSKYYNKKYDVIILAVSHQDFKEMGLKNIKYLAKENSIFYDLKSIFPDDLEAIRL